MIKIFKIEISLNEFAYYNLIDDLKDAYSFHVMTNEPINHAGLILDKIKNNSSIDLTFHELRELFKSVNMLNYVYGVKKNENGLYVETNLYTDLLKQISVYFK